MKFRTISHLPLRATCPVHDTLLDLITLILYGASTNYEAPHYAILSNLLLHNPNILPSALLPNTFSIPALYQMHFYNPHII
jgi:hypothetical protein